MHICTEVKMHIYDVVEKFYTLSKTPNHRYKSWEHCYRYFSGDPRSDEEKALLHLDSYLASWGMKRGSTRLLWKDYEVHKNVVNIVTNRRYLSIHGITLEDSMRMIDLIFQLKYIIFRIYKRILSDKDSYNPSDTLVTKVLLGTIGCFPAYDRFFREGLKDKGLPWATLSKNNFRKLIDFCQNHQDEFESVRKEISHNAGFEYPFMKIVDMYFWQIGYEAFEAERREKRGEAKV